MRTTAILLLLTLFVYTRSAAQIQHYRFNTRLLTVKDGLIHQEVNTVIQDHRGFIWMGTRFGLSRYDGYEFISYTKDKNQLNANNVDYILEDDNGHLWLFAESDRLRKDMTVNIDILNPVDGTVKKITDRFPELPFSVKSITSFFSSPSGGIFIFAANTLWKYKQGAFSIEPKIPAGFTPVACSGLTGFWGTRQNQICKVDQNGIVLSSAPIQMSDKIVPIYNPGDNFLWISNRVSVPVRVAGNTTYSPQGLPEDFNSELVNTVYYDEAKDILWIGWGRTLAAFDVTGRMIYQLRNNPDEPIIRAFTGIMTDRTGVTWVTTQSGVWMIAVKPERFVRYLYKNPADVLKDEKVYQCRGILQSGNNLFINTYVSDYRINITTGKADTLKRIKDNGSSSSYRFPLYKDSTNKLYAGANVLIEKDLVTGNELSYYKGVRGRIWSLCRINAGRLLIGIGNGLLLLDKTIADTVISFSMYNEFNELKNSTVLQIVKEDGFFYLVTNTGLYVYDERKGITMRYSTKGKQDYYLPIDNLQHLYKDKESIYWLATEGAGLIRWDKQKNIFKSYTKANSFSSNNIYAVYEDKKENLWLSSDYGIIRFNKKTEEVTNYTPEDGITHYEFNRISHYQSEDGRLYFGSLNGVTAFYPEILDDMSQLNKIGAVAVSQLQQFIGKKGNLEDITSSFLKTEKIVLQPADKFFTLKLAAPDYLQSNKTIFYYKITGLDKEWTKAEGNSIRVGRLPYGNYMLVIKAQLGNGNSAKETAIAIRVIRPFYLTWWFYVLLVALAATAVRFYYQWRIRQLEKRKKELENTVTARTLELEKDKVIIEKQAEELKQMDEMKSKFFANVSHELRTPLTLLTGPVNKLLRKTDPGHPDYSYLQLMNQNIQQLQNRVNEILDLSKADAGKLELREVPVRLKEFLTPIVASFESVIQQKNIHFLYRYRVPDELNLMLDKEQLKKILNNLLSNAFKFTPPGGQILFIVTDELSQIEFKVADTGEGIHPDDKEYIFNRFYQAKKGDISLHGGTGIGLALTSELVALMKGKIVVESEPGQGATFILELPKKPVLSPHTSIDEFIENKISPAQPVINKSAVKGATLLLVEDNPALQQYIELELEDYNLVIANHGAEALQLLESMPELPQLIISDIMMPVMDGFTLLQKIKEDERYRKLPVIMLTARADIKDKLTALRTGVDDYLVKPFITDELTARVDNLLQRYTLRNDEGWVAVPDDTGEQASLPTIVQPVSPAWLQELEQLINDYLDRKESFTPDSLSQKLYISTRQLQRNIKQETGLTLNNYIREIRLDRARGYLENKKFSTVAEISYAVGFNDQHYFSTLFTERFGKKPSEYL